MSTLKEHMSPADRKAMGSLPTYHAICKEKTGVYRPGKTAKARARMLAAKAAA